MDNDDTDEKYLSPEEAALLSLPEHLRVSSTHRSEEMLSNQMLNGIPEVDLGIEAKIRNIEATEAAKEKLLQDQKNKKSAPSHFVPTNMAVNFVQHNRCTFIRFPGPFYSLLLLLLYRLWLFDLKKKLEFILQLTLMMRKRDVESKDNKRNVNEMQTVVKSQLLNEPLMIIIMINLKNNFDAIDDSGCFFSFCKIVFLYVNC